MLCALSNSIGLICLIVLSTVSAVAQRPISYWSFDGKEPLIDQVGGKPINNSNLRNISVEKGILGNALFSPSGTYFATDMMRSAKPLTKLTLEFAFKGNDFLFTTSPKPEFRVRLERTGVLYIKMAVVRNGKTETELWIIPLKGAGVNSYSGLANNEWHHFVLVASNAGNCQLWIDGISATAFQKSFEPFSSFSISGGDGFHLTAVIDEVAFYNAVVPESVIKQRATQLLKDQRIVSSIESTAKISQASRGPHKEELDEKEFAPGYPNYTVQATDQLKSFPDPRYSPKAVKRRNFPWLDITYLHRELPGAGGKGFGKQNPAKAVELMAEMVSRWNYYYELPTLRMDSLAAKKRYENPNSIEYALIQYAKANPSIPTASVAMEIQGNPAHAGFDTKKPPHIAQDLDPKYYLKDRKGDVIIYKNKKWLSPLAPLDRTRIDAKTTAFYLRQLSRQLGRPIDFVNENAELFGHLRSSELLEKDPQVRRDMEEKGLSIKDYNGWFQNRLDTYYKNEILSTLGWNRTLFTFYDVSAYNDNYWPSYKMRRTSNLVVDGNHFSTPSFYPAFPGNWKLSTGPLNGYGTVAEGRLKEIALGDKLFAPFVSAGWSFEEKNIRPAQWLALLKSMVMLGADFFHVGYFNVTGSGGKWPNGVGPNDPRGYIYQVAMPAYAQAIGSMVPDFFTEGELLNPQKNLVANIYSFRIKGERDNQLIIARKLGNKYLIYGSIMPNSNIKGNVPLKENVRFSLDNMDLTIELRKQGSMYVLDMSKEAPVFYQLDGWHQYEHPYFWNKAVRIEAENASGSEGDLNIKTYLNAGNLNFTNYKTVIRLNSRNSASYELHDVSAANTLKLNLKSNSDASSIQISFNGKKVTKAIKNNKRDSILELNKNESTSLFGSKKRTGTLRLQLMKGEVEIDNLTVE